MTKNSPENIIAEAKKWVSRKPTKALSLMKTLPKKLPKDTVADYYQLSAQLIKVKSTVIEPVIDAYQSALTYSPERHDIRLELLEYLLASAADEALIFKHARLLIDSELAFQTYLRFCQVAISRNNKDDLIIYVEALLDCPPNAPLDETIKLLSALNKPNLISLARRLVLHYPFPPALEIPIQMSFCISEGNHSEAIKLAKHIPQSTLNDNYVLNMNLANSYEALGQFDHAFETRRHSALRFKKKIKPNLSALPSLFGVSNLQTSGQTATNAFPIKTHAILTGFPRSGTTLLERILDAQPNIATLNEHSPIFKLIEKGNAALDTENNTPLNVLTDLYQQYFQHRVACKNTDVWIDKSPWLTTQLQALPSFLPNTKIIMALRDPRAVIHSCFITSFEESKFNNHLTTLENCVNTYIAVMEYYLSIKETYPLSIIEVRYEQLIEHFDDQVDLIFEFLETAPDIPPSQFFQHARSTLITSASHSQANQPVYNGANNKWRHYEHYYQPYFAKLAPIAKKLGYPFN